jgi:hypothetical protein
LREEIEGSEIAALQAAKELLRYNRAVETASKQIENW